MIQTIPEPIEPERAKRIRAWLEKEEFVWLLEALQATVALHQAAAANILMSKPQIVMVENTMPPQAHEAMRNAARMQIGIEVLREAAKPNSPLLRVRMTPGFAQTEAQKQSDLEAYAKAMGFAPVKPPSSEAPTET